MSDFKIGDWVQCAGRGAVAPFNGQIVAERDGEFVVKDAFGRRWSRQARELSPAKGA